MFNLKFRIYLSFLLLLLSGCSQLPNSLLSSEDKIQSSKSNQPCNDGAIEQHENLIYVCVRNKWDSGGQLPTFDSLDETRVRPIAYANIAAAVETSGTFAPEIKKYVSPTTNSNNVENVISNINVAARFWSDIYKPEVIGVGLYTEAEVDSIDNTVCDQLKYCDTGNKILPSRQIKMNPENCRMGFSDKSTDGLNTPVFFMCIGSVWGRIKDEHVAGHEYTHLAQQGTGQNTANSPDWFIEGSADYFGDALLVWNHKLPQSLFDNLQNRSGISFGKEQNWCDVSTFSETQIIACLKMAEKLPTGNTSNKLGFFQNIAYYPGSLATEVLIAVKGVEVFKNFSLDIQSLGFDAAFEKSYGISVDDFYVKIAPYIKKMYESGR